MPLDFARAQNNSLHASVTAGFVGYPLTTAIWCRITGSLDSNQVLFSYWDNGAFNGNYLEFQGATAGDPVVIGMYNDFFTAGSATSTSGVSVNTWHHVCGVNSASNSHKIFLDGGSSATSTFNHTGIANCDELEFADHDQFTGNNLDGMLAHAAIWSAALSDAEVLGLSRRASPLLVRPGSLASYWPIWGRHDPEIDLIGGNHLTKVNIPAVATSAPRVYMPSRTIVGVPAAAAAASIGHGLLLSRSRNKLVLAA